MKMWCGARPEKMDRETLKSDDSDCSSHTSSNPNSPEEVNIVVLGASRVGKTTMKTCQAWRESGKSASGYYMIDPDGDSKGVEPFLVHCDMADPTGLAATRIGHGSEKRTLVDGYEGNGSYRRKIRYNATNAQVLALLDVSSHCKQFLSRECYAPFMNYYGIWANWWVSRDGVKMTYWGGAAPGSGKCACGMTGTCVSPTLVCNCDKNTAEWLSDEGFLTDKKPYPSRK